MIRHLARGHAGRGLAVAAVASALGAWSWSVERNGIERANRLYRAGETAEAVALYAARARSELPTPELQYNLGTALAELDRPEAEGELLRAALRGPRALRSSASYNVGLLRLRRALEASEPDSIRLHAEASAAANRTALRNEPADPDAKWNLAIALRMLDSISAMERRSGRELTEGAVETDMVTRSVNVPDAAEDEFAEDPPAEGENEAVAVLGDESPLTLDEAEQLLGRTHLDPTTLLGKLLALESRSRWARRPSRGVRRW